MNEEDFDQLKAEYMEALDSVLDAVVEESKDMDEFERLRTAVMLQNYGMTSLANHAEGLHRAILKLQDRVDFLEALLVGGDDK